MYVIEFPFNKIVQSFYSLLPDEKLHYRYFSGSAQKGKEVLKSTSSKTLCKPGPFL